MKSHNSVLIFLWIVTSFASINLLNVHLKPGEVWYERFAAYTVPDSPFGGTDPPSLTYNLAFTTEDKPVPWNDTDLGMALGEVLLFHYTRRAHIGVGGFSLLEGRAYCCTPDLKAAGRCDNENTLIIDSDLNRDDLYYDRLNFASYQNDDSILSANLSFGTTLEHTGVWYLFIANCETEARHGVEFLVSGFTTWKNPYGFLPGQILGYLPVYWTVAVLYMLLTLFWGYRVGRHRNDMVRLQHAISVVICVALIDSLIWAGNYTSVNKVGISSDNTNIFAALFSSFKLTIVRTLVLVVSLGLTITRLTLEKRTMVLLLLLTVIYYVVEATNLYIDVARSAGREVIDAWETFFFALLIIGNAIYFAWIGKAIYDTLNTLKPNEKEKISMYKRLSVLLTISLTTSVIIVLAELITQATDDTDEQFRASWLWQGYWELIYCACIFFVAWVWRPNEDNKRFAYIDSEEDQPPPPPPSSTDNKTINLDEDDLEPKGETLPSYTTSSESQSESQSSGFNPEPEEMTRKIPRDSKVKLDLSSVTTSSSDDS